MLNQGTNEENEVEVLDAETTEEFTVEEEIKFALMESLRKVRDAEDEDGTLMIEAQRAKSICNVANSLCNIAKTQVLIQHHNEKLGMPMKEIAMDL